MSAEHQRPEGHVVADDQRRLGNDIGRREVVLGLSGIGDRHFVYHRVVALGVEARDEAVPLPFDELRLDAEPLRDLLGDLDVETD